MKRMKEFIFTTLLGGLTVILPAIILFFVFNWLFNFITNLIQPVTDLIVASANIKEIIADCMVISVILLICFVVGIMVRTQFGKFIFHTVETKILAIAPGYNLIKETVLQLLGNKKSPFSSVALAQIFANDTLVTSFITEEHEDGSFSVFVPTGPNPTSGNIYHLDAKYVHPVDVSVEDAMRSIISCGAGSDSLVKAYKNRS